MNTNHQTDNSHPAQLEGRRQKLKKYSVFVLMGIIFAGSMWLIFAPSAKDKAKQEQMAGFNADVPMPTEESMMDDKRDAYEQEEMQQKQQERMRSLQDFSDLLGNDNAEQVTEDLSLLPDAEATPKRSNGYVPQNRSQPQTSIQSSAQAYHDMNRSLDSFYEQPKEDPEKEALKRQIEEMQAQMNETANRTNTTDEQLELMEKSFQMVAKYMPGTASTASAASTAGTANIAGAASTAKIAGAASTASTAGNGISGGTSIVPVTTVREQTVSALLPEMSDTEFVRTYGQPRNTGFITATAEAGNGTKNTLSACIYGDQTIMDGQNVRLRLLEAVQAGNTMIPRNTPLTGTAKIQGERLSITVVSTEHAGSIIPLDLRVFDIDGQSGIFIPNMAELSAAKEMVANMGTSAGTSISLSNDAGKQFAADMGRNVMQGISQFTAKKLREIKVHLKADYRIFLLSEGSLNEAISVN